MTARLTLLGVGYRVGSQATLEADAELRRADVAFHLIGDPLMVRWVRSVNARCETLLDCYVEGRPSVEAIEPMAIRVLERVRAGGQVCVAFPGHPTFVVPPAVRMRELALEEGFPVRVLPGVGAAGCLFADLGIDPAWEGVAIYEASSFLAGPGTFDPHAHVVLLQAGVIGMVDYARSHPDPVGTLQRLTDRLATRHEPDHEVLLYEVATHPLVEPRLERRPLASLPEASFSFDTTLHVPPR